MQEYNSPEEYIKDVQRYIRWSRAKVVATRELSDHINDQYDALRENGLNQKEAMRKAIEEMGDADVVGTELDIVHRPKVNSNLCYANLNIPDRTKDNRYCAWSLCCCFFVFY